MFPTASITYTAVAKSKAALPCDISAPSPDDSVTLVLWYKDESLAPIYTLDSRRGHVAQALQSSVPDMAKRAHFNMANDPAFLQIDPVEEADAGEYRCRVDFRKARSVNTVINLRVIGEFQQGIDFHAIYQARLYNTTQRRLPSSEGPACASAGNQLRKLAEEILSACDSYLDRGFCLSPLLYAHELCIVN